VKDEGLRMGVGEASCDRDDHVLVVDGLTTAFPTGRSYSEVLNQVSFCLHEREILGVVGETGSGKSITMLSVMGLVPPPGAIVGGRIRFGDLDLVGLDVERYRQLRGKEISMIVQNPSSALNPLERIGTQIRNVYLANTRLRGPDLDNDMKRGLESVGLRQADWVLRAYPHQLSGGMAQRVLIAIALAARPRIIIADEPTSGLDTTIAVKVMERLQARIRDTEAASLIVTHDLGVVAHYCDRAIVMRTGQVVDEAPIGRFFDEDGTRYRAELIAAHRWRGTEDAVRSDGRMRAGRENE
jgi:peptide/nickel transport system ATP-binding protein